MAAAKQNLVLFFEEDEDCHHIINSQLVRLYMNRFIIDEDDQTEIIGVYNIKIRTSEEYEKCFSKSVILAREKDMPNTNTHFIFGNSTIADASTYDSNWLFDIHKDSLLAKLSKVIASNRSPLGNDYAFTILHGSNSFKFYSRDYQKMAYSYQKQDDEHRMPSLWQQFVKCWRRNEIKRSINDDLELFHRRIQESGFKNDYFFERIETFHNKTLYETEELEKELDNSMVQYTWYNENLSFFRFLFAYQAIKKPRSNDKYIQFNCRRVTIYYKNTESTCKLL